jgi:hypothetical protein
MIVACWYECYCQDYCFDQQVPKLITDNLQLITCCNCLNMIYRIDLINMVYLTSNSFSNTTIITGQVCN